MNASSQEQKDLKFLSNLIKLNEQKNQKIEPQKLPQENNVQDQQTNKEKQEILNKLQDILKKKPEQLENLKLNESKTSSQVPFLEQMPSLSNRRNESEEIDKNSEDCLDLPFHNIRNKDLQQIYVNQDHQSDIDFLNSMGIHLDSPNLNSAPESIKSNTSQSDKSCSKLELESCQNPQIFVSNQLRHSFQTPDQDQEQDERQSEIEEDQQETQDQKELSCDQDTSQSKPEIKKLEHSCFDDEEPTEYQNHDKQYDEKQIDQKQYGLEQAFLQNQDDDKNQGEQHNSSSKMRQEFKQIDKEGIKLNIQGQITIIPEKSQSKQFQPSQTPRIKCDNKEVKIDVRKVDYDGDAVEFCKL